MKFTCTIFFALCVLGATVELQSQTCEQCRTPTGTTWNKLAYRYCDPATNKIVTLCTNNPYSPPAPFQNYKVLKLCLPLELGTDIVYDNTFCPKPTLGPWTEQIWLGQNVNGFEYRDSDMPSLIQAAADFWQNICSPYNNTDCQECQIKIAWTRDVAKMQDDIKNPVHSNTPLTGSCQYDCSQFSILLNATSGYTQFNGGGKPSNYFFTRGGDLAIGYSGLYVGNSDMSTEMIHRIGIMLGFGELEASDCWSPFSMMNTGKYSRWPYLERQAHRFDALDNTSDIAPPGYDFKPQSSGSLNRDVCSFKLLYCCDIPSSVSSDVTQDEWLSISPNPTLGVLNIRAKNLEGCQVEVLNSLGQVVIDRSRTLVVVSNSEASLMLSELESGTYSIRLTNGSKVVFKQFIILR